METASASFMPPPLMMSPEALVPQEDPLSAFNCARSDDPHAQSETQNTQMDQDKTSQLRESAAPVERSKDSSMPPPPPMPQEVSAGQAKLVDPSGAASSDGAQTPSVTQSTQFSWLSREAGKDISQISSEKERRYNGAWMQSSFNNSIYSIPSWSAAPAFPFVLEVIKDGALVDTLEVSSKGAYMFGRSDQCDFMMEHPSISRFHAVLQFKRNGEGFVYDLGSTHGTIINKKQIAGRTFVPIHVGDLFKLGLSSRLYVLQGPAELMPKEGPTKLERQILGENQGLFDTAERDASLLRAKREAEGATWGMTEDAIEGDMQEEEEITWQTYKGQLTEKQQKTLEKIHKRNEKVASLKREIDAIQVKEIPQGGLTQGQQTQVARNQQRIEQLMEELDNLEETLNQSIQESTGARARKGSGRKGSEDEEGDLSDDDDFYDRTSFTKKLKGNKGGEPAQIVETAESLLEKRANVLMELERLNQLLVLEGKKDGKVSEVPESQDPLDAFMTTVSSKLESDHALNLRQEIEKQQADLNRIVFLLKIADPSGEAQKNWKEPQAKNSEEDAMRQTNQKLSKKESVSKVRKDESRETIVIENINNREATIAPGQVSEQKDKSKQEEVKGPLWLGHARKNAVEKTTAVDGSQGTPTSDKDFIEYKERHKSVLKMKEQDTPSDIQEGACGLILRKPKDVAKVVTQEDGDVDKKLWEGAALAAADTVALLLRHQKGLGALMDDEIHEECTPVEEVPNGSKKRKLGPDRPEFLNREEGKFQAWVPPAGQTGDGRTSLNEKYGY
ncbi:hypothetical protein GOP47_0004721 [Adiantum capillus-veneris]|uniref:FHA domain-containing protein n=1 Tax=Adiantum capillus-veneris TaxID=13818 RepID=A0A9D4V5C6_ADICA|nr:hypothetical protein GOP47_0004721 [Adiantum capillus-veneris]